MLKIFCLITGDDYNLVRVETPASRKKISALATVILIPVATWFVIGFAIGTTILKLPMSTSFCIGIGTASIIFIIERVIIMSGTNKWLVGLRIFMGLLIAILGSVFIDEVIFEKDIEQQVFMDRKELIEVEQGRIYSEYDASITEAKTRTADTYHQWFQALEEAKQESDGSGGSGVRGIHSIAKLKLNISKQLEANYSAAKSELSALETKLEADLAATHLSMIQNITGNSMLFRIKSLFRLVLSDNWVLAIYCMFTILLFILEFIVIIMKHALAETNYERRVAAMETVGKRRLASITDRDLRCFDPSDSTEPILKAERTLEKATPTLFGSVEKEFKYGFSR